MGIRKKTEKIILVILIVGAVGFIANILADNPYTQRFARLMINEKIKKITTLKLDFKALKVNLFPLGIQLYGFNVTSGGSSNTSLVKASQVKCEISIWSLIAGKPKLGLVEAVDLEFAWPFTEEIKDFGFKTEPAAGASEWVPTWPLFLSDMPIERIVLKNSRIYFSLPPSESKDGSAATQSPLMVSINGLDLDFNIQSWDSFRTSLEIASLTLHASDLNILEQAKLNVDLKVKGNSIRASFFKIKAPDLDFKGLFTGDIKTQGQKNEIDSISLNASVDGTGNLSMLARVLDLKDVTRGPVQAGFTFATDISVKESKPFTFSIDGGAGVKDGYLDGFRLRDAKGTVHADTDKLAFKNFSIVIDDKQVATADGEIFFNDAINFDFAARPNGLKFTDLLNALGVNFDVLNFDISGQSITVSGQGDPFKLAVKGNGKISNIIPKGLDKTKKFALPECTVAVNLLANMRALAFEGTSGTCYEPVPSKDGAPDGQGKFVTPLKATGTVPLDGKSGFDLILGSPSANLELVKYLIAGQASGTAKVQTRIHGPTPSKILVTTDVNASGVEIYNVPLGDVSGNFEVDDDVLRWTHVESKMNSANWRGAIISERGSLKFNDGLLFNASVIANNVPANVIGPIIKAIDNEHDMAFRIDSLHADLKGPLLVPLGYQGGISFELAAGKFDNALVFDSASGNIELGRDGISSNNLKIKLGDLLVSSSFEHKRSTQFSFAKAINSKDLLVRLGIDPKDSIVFDSGTVAVPPEAKPAEVPDSPDTDQLQKLPIAGEYFKLAGLQGKLAYTAKFQGNFEEVQGTFDVMLDNVRLFDSELAPIELHGIANSSKMDIVFSHAGNALQGRISLAYKEPGIPYDWYFKATQADLRALGTKFFSYDPKNYAYISGDWEMKGKFLSWWESTGKINVEDIRINLTRNVAGQTRYFVLMQDKKPVTILISPGGGWIIAGKEELSLRGDRLNFKISTNKNRPPDNLDVAFDGVADLALLKDMFAEVENATGKVLIEGALTGSISDPDLTLKLTDAKSNPYTVETWQPLSIGIAGLRPPLKNIELNVSYEDEKFIIESLKADKGGGKVSAHGTLSFEEAPEEGQASQLELNFSNASLVFPIPVLKNFESSVSGNIHISGSQFPLKMAGDIDIVKAQSMGQFDIRNEIIEVLKHQSYVVPSALEQPLFNLDLSVRAKDSIAINNRNIQASLSSDIKVTGTDVAPILTGQIQIVKGKFAYKRDFKVTRGVLTFDDPSKADPRLDIMGICEVSDYRVYFTTTGRASDPKVDLSIDPPTREDGTTISKMDILNLLSTGALPDTTKSDLASKNTAQAEALNILAGQFEEPVEKLFDLSGQKVIRQVYIDTYPNPNKAGTPTPRLNMPLNLAEDWDVIFRVDESTWRLSLGYSVNDSISVSGSYEGQQENNANTGNTTYTPTTDDTGVDLKFRFAFP